MLERHDLCYILGSRHWSSAETSILVYQLVMFNTAGMQMQLFSAYFLPASQITYYLKSFYVFCVFGEYRQKIETRCELISLSTNFLQIMICWYYLECIVDTLRGTGIWGSWWELVREPWSHRHVWSKMKVWFMKGNLGCITASPAHPAGGKGRETGVRWRRLACIYLTHGFISVESVAEKSKLEGVFMCTASVKHRAWEHAASLSPTFSVVP